MTSARADRPLSAEEALAVRLDRLAHRPSRAAGAAAPTGARRTRRHPAQAARYAAVGVSIASTIGLTALFTREASGSQQAVSSAAVVSGGPTAGSSSATVGSSSATTVAASGSSTASRVVDGAAFDNRYGTVQIEATFGADGSLTSLTALQTPNDRGRSIEINDQAVPLLTQEAISAQSAHIDTVGGATYTSGGYEQSLQSAIDAARAVVLTCLT